MPKPRPPMKSRASSRRGGLSGDLASGQIDTQDGSTVSVHVCLLAAFSAIHSALVPHTSTQSPHRSHFQAVFAPARAA